MDVNQAKNIDFAKAVLIASSLQMSMDVKECSRLYSSRLNDIIN
jgi:hypothetical protein